MTGMISGELLQVDVLPNSLVSRHCQVRMIGLTFAGMENLACSGMTAHPGMRMVEDWLSGMARLQVSVVLGNGGLRVVRKGWLGVAGGQSHPVGGNWVAGMVGNSGARVDVFLDHVALEGEQTGVRANSAVRAKDISKYNLEFFW